MFEILYTSNYYIFVNKTLRTKGYVVVQIIIWDPFMKTFLQVLIIPPRGEAIWEEGENRRFSLSLPPRDISAADKSASEGGFLIMFHWGMSSTENLYFPTLRTGKYT